jgi:hypothetical protein
LTSRSASDSKFARPQVVSAAGALPVGGGGTGAGAVGLAGLSAAAA